MNVKLYDSIIAVTVLFWKTALITFNDIINISFESEGFLKIVFLFR